MNENKMANADKTLRQLIFGMQPYLEIGCFSDVILCRVHYPNEVTQYAKLVLLFCFDKISQINIYMEYT